MEKFEPAFAEPEKEKKFKHYFRPAKYLIPAAVFAAVLAGGCDTDTTPPGADDGTGDGTDDGTDDGTLTSIFKAPVELTLNGAISSVSYYVFHPALADIDSDGDLDIFLGAAGLVSSDGPVNFQFVIFYRNGEVPLARSVPVLNEDSGFISYLPSHNIGTWSSSIGPMFTTAGDIDGDGDIEIIGDANVYYNGDIGAFFGNIFFTYQHTSVSSLATYSDSNPMLLRTHALIDLDGDSDLDLVQSAVYTSSVYVVARDLSSSYPVAISYMLNDGTGNFYPFSPDGILVDFSGSDSFSSLPIPSFVDVDGDGDPDMFVTMYSSGGTDVKFYRNSGSHNFTQEAVPVDFSLLADPAVNYFPAFGDVDGDNDIDIVIGTNEPKLYFVENTTVP